MSEKIKKAGTEHIRDAVKEAEERYNGALLKSYGGSNFRYRERDENLLVDAGEASSQNSSRSRIDKILGRGTLTAVDIAHEKAKVENALDTLRKIKKNYFE